MKRMHSSVKDALRNILPSNEGNRPTKPPPPSEPVVTIAHVFAIYRASASVGTSLTKYPGPPLSLRPLPFTGGDLRYRTANSAACHPGDLANLVRVAKMTLLAAEESSSSFSSSAPPPPPAWDAARLQDEVAQFEAGHVVQCQLLPLLNVQRQEHITRTGAAPAWRDLDAGKFVHELWASSATWGVSLALLVRRKSGRWQLQLQQKPLPPLPVAEEADDDHDEEEGDGGDVDHDVVKRDPKRVTI